jgi:uncharacterized protein (DUF58 family)
MIPRKKIIAPKLSAYFKYEKNSVELNNQLYFNTRLFNGFAFLSTLILVSFFLGFYKSLFWCVAISCVLLLYFLYQKTLRLSAGISIKRTMPKFVREKTEITVTYLVSNETGFRIEALGFMEEFDGVESGSFWVEGQMIPPHTQIKIIKNIFLNTGMGIKTIQNIKINIRDELGIFDFKVEFLETAEIEVYPYTELTPNFKNSISPDSLEFGLYELAKRGDSNLFIGTREYRKGDPVKHINWKLTKKSDKVIINEYEKSTNTYVTLLLDLNLKNQTGIGEKSTWETAKDLALSIANNEIKKNNSVQAIANNLYIPFGSGRNQIGFLEKYFVYHEMMKTDTDTYIRHLSMLPPKGQVYFICPIPFTTDSLKTIEELKRVKSLGHTVIIFTLNPLKEVSQTVQRKLKLSLLEIDRHSENESKSIKTELNKQGIPLIPITIKKDIKLYDQVVKHSKNLLEIK